MKSSLSQQLLMARVRQMLWQLHLVSVVLVALVVVVLFAVVVVIAAAATAAAV